MIFNFVKLYNFNFVKLYNDFLKKMVYNIFLDGRHFRHQKRPFGGGVLRQCFRHLQN